MLLHRLLTACSWAYLQMDAPTSLAPPAGSSATGVGFSDGMPAAAAARASALAARLASAEAYSVEASVLARHCCASSIATEADASSSTCVIATVLV
jgi:hypothetical protein